MWTCVCRRFCSSEDLLLLQYFFKLRNLTRLVSVESSHCEVHSVWTCVCRRFCSAEDLLFDPSVRPPLSPPWLHLCRLHSSEFHDRSSSPLTPSRLHLQFLLLQFPSSPLTLLRLYLQLLHLQFFHLQFLLFQFPSSHPHSSLLSLSIFILTPHSFSHPPKL